MGGLPPRRPQANFKMTHDLSTALPNRLTLRSDGELMMIDGTSVKSYLRGVLKAHGLEGHNFSVVIAPRDGLEQWRRCLVKVFPLLEYIGQCIAQDAPLSRTTVEQILSE
jgi:hypothetical protein